MWCVCVCVKETEAIQEVRHFPPVMYSFNFLYGVSKVTRCHRLYINDLLSNLLYVKPSVGNDFLQPSGMLETWDTYLEKLFHSLYLKSLISDFR